jgi:hypothetical protein
MANDVFANGREISCKKADGKSICAFPDVCFTPPENPATPPGVPIPYPNTGLASDTTSGSKKVKISGNEIMLKNKSYFKKSIGDEAGCAAKKGIISSVNRGKVYFIAWSMDVKAEGENVVRHFDMTTHNHASPMANEAIPWPYVDAAALADPGHPCNKYASDVADKCPPPEKSLGARQPAEFIGGKLIDRGDFPDETIPPGPQDNTSDDCCEARKCMLVPNAPASRCEGCGGKTPHHPVPVADLSTTRQPHPETGKLKERGDPLFPGYDHNKAPCVCVDGIDHNKDREGPTEMLKQHGRINRKYVIKRNEMLGDRQNFSFNEASSPAAQAVAEETKCDEDCIKKQLDKGHEAMKVDLNEPIMRKGENRAPALERKPAAKTKSIG